MEAGVAIAICLGALAGIAGALPLIGGMRLARKATPTSNLGHAGSLMLGVLGSFVVLGVAVAVCIALARDRALPFVLAEAAALVAFTLIFGIRLLFGNR